MLEWQPAVEPVDARHFESRVVLPHRAGLGAVCLCIRYLKTTKSVICDVLVVVLRFIALTLLVHLLVLFKLRFLFLRESAFSCVHVYHSPTLSTCSDPLFLSPLLASSLQCQSRAKTGRSSSSQSSSVFMKYTFPCISH